MIKIYLSAIPSLYEGEDIELRYCIFENEELVSKEFAFLRYEKPAVVGQVALVNVLREIGKYSEQEIEIIVNDPALAEFIRGTSTTKNKDVLKMGRQTKQELGKFQNIRIKDVHADRAELLKWDQILQF